MMRLRSILTAKRATLSAALTAGLLFGGSAQALDYPEFAVPCTVPEGTAEALSDAFLDAGWVALNNSARIDEAAFELEAARLAMAALLPQQDTPEETYTALSERILPRMETSLYAHPEAQFLERAEMVAVVFRQVNGPQFQVVCEFIAADIPMLDGNIPDNNLWAGLIFAGFLEEVEHAGMTASLVGRRPNLDLRDQVRPIYRDSISMVFEWREASE